MDCSTGTMEPLVNEFRLQAGISLPVGSKARARVALGRVQASLHVPTLRTLQALAIDWQTAYNLVSPTDQLVHSDAFVSHAFYYWRWLFIYSWFWYSYSKYRIWAAVLSVHDTHECICNNRQRYFNRPRTNRRYSDKPSKDCRLCACNVAPTCRAVSPSSLCSLLYRSLCRWVRCVESIIQVKRPRTSKTLCKFYFLQHFTLILFISLIHLFINPWPHPYVCAFQSQNIRFFFFTFAQMKSNWSFFYCCGLLLMSMQCPDISSNQASISVCAVVRDSRARVIFLNGLNLPYWYVLVHRKTHLLLLMHAVLC